MGFFAEFSAALALIVLGLVWFRQYTKVQYRRDRLKWVKNRPGVFVVGNAPEFAGGSTEYLDKLRLMVKETGADKCVHLELVYRAILVMTHHKLVEFVLGSNSLKLLEKSEDYEFLRPWLANGLLTSGGAKWKKRRRILTPAFHFQILEQFIDVFEDNGNVMVKKLEKELGQTSFDVYPYVTLCTLDIICETAMGVSINAQNNKDSDYVRSVKEMCRIIVERSFSPVKMFDIFYKFTEDYKIEKKAIGILHGHTTQVIQQRRNELSQKQSKTNDTEDDIGLKKRKAFLDLLLEAKQENGQPLSDEDIREEVDTFMFEGHDTTASAISFAIYMLANNPQVQQKVMQEQREIFAEERRATYRDLQEMKYLENVIKEALRLFPSVPFYARCVTDDIEYQPGKIIPKDTTVLIFTFGTNRDPDYYENPEEFRPERFDAMDGTSPYAYVPFSAGPRNCIGQKFAMLEMKSTISKVVRNFELQPAFPEHKLSLAAETVLKSSNGVKIRLAKRS